MLIPFSFIYILPKLTSYEDMVKFDRLLFPWVIIAFISQISTFLTGHYWVDYLGGDSAVGEDLLLVSEDQVSRAGSSAYILLYCFIKEFFIYLIKEPVPRNIHDHDHRDSFFFNFPDCNPWMDHCYKCYTNANVFSIQVIFCICPYT